LAIVLSRPAIVVYDDPTTPCGNVVLTPLLFAIG
jgi:hypothetical protein